MLEWIASANPVALVGALTPLVAALLALPIAWVGRKRAEVAPVETEAAEAITLSREPLCLFPITLNDRIQAVEHALGQVVQDQRRNVNDMDDCKELLRDVRASSARANEQLAVLAALAARQ